VSMPRLKLVQGPTRHPCSGMTKAQRRDFELIAINQPPRGGRKTIMALKARCLIVDAAPKVVGRDRFGEIKIPQWTVPLAIHAQWCKWCAENVEVDLP
jgi:hypothetical protein